MLFIVLCQVRSIVWPPANVPPRVVFAVDLVALQHHLNSQIVTRKSEDGQAGQELSTVVFEQLPLRLTGGVGGAFPR